MERRLEGFQFDGLPNVGDGLRMATGLIGEQAEQMQGVGVAWVGLEDLAVQSLRLRHIAGLMVVDSPAKEVRDG
jgi:hypothetical protein